MTSGWRSRSRTIRSITAISKAPFPKGQYGGGTVQLWDRGYWESDDPEQGFKKGDLKFTLHGDKLHGSWVLVRMRHDRNGGKRTNWLLIKHRDEYAREGEANAILDEDQSVASGRSMDRDRRRQGQRAEAVHDRRSPAARQGRRGLAFEPGRGRRSAGREQERRATKASESEAVAKRKRQESRGDAGFRRAAALRLGRSPAGRRRLVPRDQVRRLSRAVAGRGRRGRAQDPQGAGLDRQISGDRQGGQRAAGHADRWRDRRARSQRRAGFFDAAGRDFRRQDRQA